ncbi:MAG: DUF3025 domain-containing protein [Burkholderiales bacterium]|nr:DUF3025 domain-containing protein [Burkholderiales bacterium]
MPIAQVGRKTPTWLPDRVTGPPMFAPLAEFAGLLPGDRWPHVEQLSGLAARRAITVRSGKRLRFVAQDAEAARPYEARIFAHGEVQTRTENWHDLFNALVWLAFPEIKAVLNARHHAELQARVAHESRNRGPLRDALTLFDESGVIVACANPELARLLHEFRWKELFWARRAETVADVRFFVFGHALYEKALAPYPGMTGHAVMLDVDRGFMQLAMAAQRVVLDERLADYFSSEALNKRAFSPLPLLGVPGWAEENAHECYYDNGAYFRSGRRTRGG